MCEGTKYSLCCHKRDQRLSQGSGNTPSQEMVPTPETVLVISSGSCKTLRARTFREAKNRGLDFSSNKLKNKDIEKDLILDL